MNPQRRPVFAFASFVFDSENRRLTHNAIPVRINSQILDLLELLLLNPGGLITREQIRARLWPNQQFVNHEKIVTNAVSRLRHILRDDPAKPRFIESVPREGYRLIVDVKQKLPTAEMSLEPRPVFPAVESAPDSGPRLATLAPILVNPRQTSLPRLWHRASRRRNAWLYMAAMLLLSAAAFGGWRWWMAGRAAAVPAEISLGIAPFQTSDDAAKDLAESFRLDLTDALSQLPHVNVRAAHSLELFSQDGSSFRDRANKLGLDALLIGSFSVAGNECHIQLELVRGKDLTHIATFDHTVSRYELASLREKIQGETFASLRVARTPAGEIPKSDVGGTSDPRAYDAFLRAGYHLSEESRESLPLAIKEYGEAVSIDPHFARAYARQARTFFYLEQNNLLSEKEGFREASEAANRALALDPASAEAHGVLGFVYFLHDWKLAAGENELRKAVLSDPNEPFYHQGLALIYCDEGRFREARAEVDAAHASDPFWVSAYITDLHVASIGKDNVHAQASMRKLMELEPDSPHARDGIGNAQWNLGQYVDAIATWREMAVIEGDPDRVAMEDRGLQAFQNGGVQAYARVRLAEIQAGKGTQLHSNDFVAAEWYGYAGEQDAALKAIRAGIALHDSSILGLAVLPAYDSLRANSDYQAIVASLGLSLDTRQRQ